jgi:hypothetical protein
LTTSSNPFLKRLRKDKTQSKAYRRAPKQEKEGAKRLGGFKTAASGSLSQKGDVTVPNLARVEYKCTSNKSFSVDLVMLDKINNAGIANNQVPFIEIEFLGAAGKTKSRLAVLNAVELEILLTRMRDAETEVATLRRRR